jgi:hypothetical protein
MSNRDAAAIEAEIAWFTSVLHLRFRPYGGEAEDGSVEAPLPPQLPQDGPPYAAAVSAAGLSPDERLILILAAMPHLRPQALDPLLLVNQQTGQRFTEFGGVDAGTSGFFPSWETALFLLSGEDMARRIDCLALFDPHAPLRAHDLLQGPSSEDCPGAIPLRLNAGVAARLTRGC